MTDQSSLLPGSAEAAAPSAGGGTRSLYRKYRPQSFDAADLVGQEHIVRILRNAIRLDRIAHAYLFCGPRGTGKTTTARLLAKAVNCLHPDPDRRPCNECASCVAITSGAATDIIEIDAASNRGIDDIRDLRERVKYAPVQLHTKFYIVDEAHQITGAAANAFLKTLEEPPSHTKFVLATTDPEELLPTIVSRCQRFDFRRIGFDAAVGRLRTVATAEGLAIDDDALAVIARHSTGSLRDGLSLLDQLSLYAEPAEDGSGMQPVSVDMVRALLGVSRNDRVESLVAAIADNDAASALGIINAAVEAGEDPRQINRQLVAYLRVLLHQRAGGTVDADDRARELAGRFEIGRLADLARRFGEIDFAIKHSPYSHLPLEVALVEATLPASAPHVAAPSAAPTSAPLPRTRDHAPDPVPIRELRDEPMQPRTSLRDRVRGVQAPVPPSTMPEPHDPNRAQSQSSAPVSIAAPPSAPSAANPAPSAANPAPAAPASGTLTVDQLADLWPRIRLDVKAVNRRIEALLASVDPVRVDGDVVTLAAAYEFHRDRMNTDEVRSVMESVIGRQSGRTVTVQCIMRTEMPPVAPTPIRPTPQNDLGPEPGSVPEPPLSAAPPKDEAPPTEPVEAAGAADPVQANGHHDLDEIAAHEQRLRAAKNIFDAEEVEPER